MISSPSPSMKIQISGRAKIFCTFLFWNSSHKIGYLWFLPFFDISFSYWVIKKTCWKSLFLLTWYWKIVKNEDMQFCRENLKMYRKKNKTFFILRSGDSNPRLPVIFSPMIWILMDGEEIKSKIKLHMGNAHVHEEHPSEIIPSRCVTVELKITETPLVKRFIFYLKNNIFLIRMHIPKLFDPILRRPLKNR